VYSNYFINSPVQASMDPGCYGNVFNMALPVGGNYWSNWDSPDRDNDGLVDLTYSFTGGQDILPLSLGGLVRRLVPEPDIADSLLAKLKSAEAAKSNAKAGDIKAFMNEVEAQTGKATSADDAAILIVLASSF
jgi:hypothetical protein